MREKQRQIRGKHVLESLKQPQPDWKSKQFANVKSRLFELPRPTPNQQLPHKRESLSSREQVPKDEDDKEEEMDLAAFEKECERLKQLHGRKPEKPVENKAEARGFQKDSAGCPAYLQKIKTNLADQQRQAEAERRGPEIPAGYRQMPDDERIKTLEALQKKRDDLEKAFRNLPLTIETASQRQRQKMVLEKIEETDKAIKTFSNPKVLIQA
jgi:hypothetical protein